MTATITVTPRTASAYIKVILNAGLVPYIHGSPGIGKSTIIKAIADAYKLKLIDYRASTGAPEDLNGLPDRKDGKAFFTPFTDNFPIGSTPIPEGYIGWLLFLDELSNAQKHMQGALYKLILDRQVGVHDLHEAVVLVAAGNSVADRAAANQLGTALKSRLVHLHMVVNFDEWLEDVAIPQNFSSEIIAFLSMNQYKLMDFDPARDDNTFACPRTWSMCDSLIRSGNGPDGQHLPVTHGHLPLYAGTIGSDTAVEFITYCQVFDQLPKLEDIIRSPSTAMLPTEGALLWATASMLQRELGDNIQHLSAFLAYVQRLPASYLVLFGRSARSRFPSVENHSAWATFRNVLAQAMLPSPSSP